MTDDHGVGRSWDTDDRDRPRTCHTHFGWDLDVASDSTEIGTDGSKACITDFLSLHLAGQSDGISLIFIETTLELGSRMHRREAHPPFVPNSHLSPSKSIACALTFFIAGWTQTGRCLFIPSCDRGICVLTLSTSERYHR
jgi:hypothetical protein